jgi:hypothetical protein
LNEQPDELKKPGQLVEALNVIPDPTIGLTRRAGFELIPQSTADPLQPDVNPDPEGTWFEMKLQNQINTDYIYFGNITKDGQVVIFNQDGEKQSVRYTADGIGVLPHKKYVFENERISILDDNDEEINSDALQYTTKNGYFRHSIERPLKYCVSKNNIIFTNPKEVVRLTKATKPTDEDQNRYYSFMNLKLVDTANYNYIFKVFGSSDDVDTYRYITEVDATEIDDIEADYDKDTTLPLQTEGPFVFELGNQGQNGIQEVAQIELTFVGQVVQLKSSDGDGYRNEARYSWSTQIITPGKGYKKGQVFKNTLPGVAGNEDLEVTFVIGDVNTTTGTENVDVNPEVTNDMNSDEILRNLQSKFRATSYIDKAIIVGNGIYLESEREFSISTSEIAVADVINSQKIDNDYVPLARINTVGELPVECYAGFIVEVTNSFDDQNNYYLQYKSESETLDLDLTKADGYWEEIAKPFESHNPRNGTLPHMITVARQFDKDKYVFVVSPVSYEKRTAGTIKDNPSMFRDNATITDINYYKNRLFFFTNVGSVISSRAGEINNIFLDTAINVSTIDPIDVIANSNQRVPIYGSSIVNNGMVLFGDSEQYMVTTNSDILSSETVNVTKVANYTFDPVSLPIYLGANLGFISKGQSRFYEMTNLYERGPVDINERSQQVQLQFGRNFNMPVSSREQSLALVYKSAATSNEMMLYRFRQENSQESSQTSWVRWQLDRPVCYVSMPQDLIFTFVKDESKGAELYKMSPDNTTRFTDGYLEDIDGEPYSTIVKFPRIYPRSGENSDVMANTTIHRVKLSTANIGTYNLKIERMGYDTYDLLVEQTPSDSYNSDGELVIEDRIETVPIYTRNKNLTLTMSTDYDAPLTLRSMTWEGDYNRPYYKSV